MNDEKKAASFDPRKLVQEVAGKAGETVLALDLKHKKTWFRLACPNGGVVLNPLRVTDQMAIFEARLFADKDDRNPMASFTAIRAADKSAGRQYIQAAQDAALNEALDNAGFGPEFCGVTLAEGLPRPRSTQTSPQETQKTAALVGKADVPPAPPADAPKQGTQTVSAEQQDNDPSQRPAQVKEDAPAPAPVVAADTPSAPVVEAPKQNEPPAPPVEEPRQSAPPAPASAADVRPAPVGPQPRGTAVPTPAAQRETTPAVVNIADHQPTPAGPVSSTQPGSAAVPAPQPEAVQADAAPEAGEIPAQFTADMDVEQICKLMTMEYARGISAPSGIRKGWTLGQVADEAPASLKWYRHVCPDADNITKAACQLLLDDLKQKDGLKQAG